MKYRESIRRQIAKVSINEAGFVYVDEGEDVLNALRNKTINPLWIEVEERRTAPTSSEDWDIKQYDIDIEDVDSLLTAPEHNYGCDTIKKITMVAICKCYI